MQKLLAVLLLVASVPAGADIYKWTDENGKVHFGDSAAGAGQPAATVTPSSRAGTSPAGREKDAPDAAQAQERRQRLLDAFQRDQEEREAGAKRQAEARAQQDHECQRVRDALQGMDGRVLYTKGPDGERQYLDDSQRQDYANQANRYLEQNCR